MTAAELLEHLDRCGVEVRTEAGKIRYRPAAAVGPELRSAIAQCKAELLAMLVPPPAPTVPSNGPRSDATARPCWFCGCPDWWSEPGFPEMRVCRRCHPPVRPI